MHRGKFFLFRYIREVCYNGTYQHWRRHQRGPVNRHPPALRSSRLENLHSRPPLPNLFKTDDRVLLLPCPFWREHSTLGYDMLSSRAGSRMPWSRGCSRICRYSSPHSDQLSVLQHTAATRAGPRLKAASVFSGWTCSRHPASVPPEAVPDMQAALFACIACILTV